MEQCIKVDKYEEPKHYSENVTLKQYIKNKDISRNKVGLIQAFKVDPEWFNYQCVDSALKKSKPFVIIVHSKAHSGLDKFDLEKAEDITYSKCDFVIEVLSGEKQKRKKYLYEMPTKETLKLYKDMYERSRRYYKDCDEIIMYHEVFEYINEDDMHIEEDDSKILSNYKKLKEMILEGKHVPNNFISITETITPCKEHA
jgi:hypothetical protein